MSSSEDSFEGKVQRPKASEAHQTGRDHHHIPAVSMCKLEMPPEALARMQRKAVMTGTNSPRQSATPHMRRMQLRPVQKTSQTPFHVGKSTGISLHCRIEGSEIHFSPKKDLVFSGRPVAARDRPEINPLHGMSYSKIAPFMTPRGERSELEPDDSHHDVLGPNFR